MPLNINAVIDDHLQAIERVKEQSPKLERVATLIKATFEAGGSVFVCGNGGSASDSQHFAAELTGRYNQDRPGYPAIALTTDTSALTAIGNDYGFESIFSRQLQSIAKPGDLLVAISTSGNSSNVVRAVEFAKEHEIKSVGLLGRDGGKLAQLVDTALTINIESTARVQEAHILMLHIICETFEPK